MNLNKTIRHINNSLFAAKMENLIQYMYEDELKTKIASIFHSMREEILTNLEEYYGDIMVEAHTNLILAPVHEHHKAYYDTIMKYKLREYRKGKTQAKRLVTRAKKYALTYSKIHGAVKADTTIPMTSIIQKDDLFATSEFSAQYMRDKTFVASENTLARVDNDINQIITNGYKDGWGIRDVSNRISTRFDQLESWEAERIARTEIHGSHMKGVMRTYEEMNVEYTQWASAHDNRTRDSHIEIDGEIIPFGGVFSNGLAHPGDTSGPIEEWINCRCGCIPWFCPPGFMVPPGMTHFRESDIIPIQAVPTVPEKPVELTQDEVNKMSFEELANYYGVEYHGLRTYDYDGKKYYTFAESFDDGHVLMLRLEEGAVKSYTKKGIATPNEIINEVFKVPKSMKQETSEIWFKNTNQGIIHKPTKTGYDSFDQVTGGYNAYTPIQYKARVPQQTDFNHMIAINPKYFKGGGKGRYSSLWEQGEDMIINWKKTIHHEFTHSLDRTKNQWINDEMLPTSYGEYSEIEKAERGFTWYANTSIGESFAEHGGYISYMEANPTEQAKLITIERIENGQVIKKDINYEEYKEIYPKHYEYFVNKFKG